MKKILLFLFLFFALAEVKAGCCLRLRLYYKNSELGSITFPGAPSVLRLDPKDSLRIRPDACGCGMTITKIFLEDKEIFSGNVSEGYSSGKTIICTPGNYTVYFKYQYAAELTLQFTILNDPVGINDPEANPGALTLFPNPAKEDVTIRSGKEELKSISVFDLSSQLIKSYEVSGNSATLPLEGIPPGIYFVKVATINERSSIRKLVVQ